MVVCFPQTATPASLFSVTEHNSGATTPCTLTNDVLHAGDDGDCMYIILKGTCNVHVDPTFDESAQAGALQKASLAPKVVKKKTAASALTKPHLARLNSTMRLDRMSSNVSTASDSSRHSSASLDKGGADNKHRRTLMSRALFATAYCIRPVFNHPAPSVTGSVRASGMQFWQSCYTQLNSFFLAQTDAAYGKPTCCVPFHMALYTQPSPKL